MTAPDDLGVGDVIEVGVDRVAHGGHCVGRHDGRVVFVRHALPGERIRARITDAPGHGRFLRADAVEVLEASADRVAPPCPYAGDCGGCDWQHASLDSQRRLKADIVREQLVRLGGEDPGRWADLTVAAVPGDRDGLGWRTRMRFAVDDTGTAGMRRHRSHDVVSVERCLLATERIDALGVTSTPWPGIDSVLAIDPAEGHARSIPDPAPGAARVIERAAGRTWPMDATAFWQSHRGAPDALVDRVREVLAPRAGEHLVDLYAGVGLFGGALAGDLGPGGRIDAVESDPVAVRSARRSLHDLPTVLLHEERVDRWLAHTPLRRCDLVVLDPPRSGAGAQVLRRVARLRPRAIAYVACDPAALGRDVATLRDLGWRLERLHALDCFPMTHHVECVALLVPIEPADDPGRGRMGA